jgi:hypothetical protein
MYTKNWLNDQMSNDPMSNDPMSNDPMSNDPMSTFSMSNDPMSTAAECRTYFITLVSDSPPQSLGDERKEF